MDRWRALRRVSLALSMQVSGGTAYNERYVKQRLALFGPFSPYHISRWSASDFVVAELIGLVERSPFSFQARTLIVAPTLSPIHYRLDARTVATFHPFIACLSLALLPVYRSTVQQL